MASTQPSGADKPLLIKTNTCPACRTAITLLDGAGVSYDILSDSDEGYDETVRRYGVRHVPTLILHPDGGWTALSGTDEIRKFVKTQA